jgi:hypothetical protein
MILQQGESVKSHARRVQAVCQLRAKPPAVIIVSKEHPPSVAPAGDTVNGIRRIDA